MIKKIKNKFFKKRNKKKWGLTILKNIHFIFFSFLLDLMLILEVLDLNIYNVVVIDRLSLSAYLIIIMLFVWCSISIHSFIIERLNKKYNESLNN